MLSKRARIHLMLSASLLVFLSAVADVPSSGAGDEGVVSDLSLPSVVEVDDLWGPENLVHFTHAGRQGFLVIPENAAQNTPWLWSAQPLKPDALSSVLLSRGFHLAWMDVEDLYGNDEAVACWDAFYTWAVQDKGLSDKPALIGKRENALLMFNWAARNLHRVACLFGEEPWLQIEPASEPGDPLSKQVCAAHGIDGDAQGSADSKMPLNAAAAFGENAIPILFLHSEPSEVPALKKQTDLFYQSYRRAGYGPVETIVKTVGDTLTQEGIKTHTLYFFLKHTGQFPEAPLEEAVPQMPEWVSADFSGQAGVYALDNVLILESGNDMTGVRWGGEPPKMDYEITLEAMRLSGGDFFCGLTAPWQDSVFSLVVGGWGGTCVGISSLDWLDAYHNETAQFRTFHAHRWYPVKLRVTREHIQAWVNKEQLVDLEIGDRTLDIRWEMAPTSPLGIATWRTTGAIRNFKVVPL